MRRDDDSHIKKLIEDFPSVFGSKDDLTADYGIGWDLILRTFCSKIKEIEETDKLSIHCIKEKLGTLRIYSFSPDLSLEKRKIVEEAVSEAYESSCITCETCGNPGVLRSGAWLQTLCEAHAEGRPEYFPYWRQTTELGPAP